VPTLWSARSAVAYSATIWIRGRVNQDEDF